MAGGSIGAMRKTPLCCYLLQSNTSPYCAYGHMCFDGITVPCLDALLGLWSPLNQSFLSDVFCTLFLLWKPPWTGCYTANKSAKRRCSHQWLFVLFRVPSNASCWTKAVGQTNEITINSLECIYIQIHYLHNCLNDFRGRQPHHKKKPLTITEKSLTVTTQQRSWVTFILSLV